MSNILAKQTLYRQHHYKAPARTVPTQQKMDRLPQEAFERPPSQESMPFLEVQGKNQTPEWYSPGAIGLGVSTADTPLLRDCFLKDQWDNTRTAWHGSIFTSKRQLVFQKRTEKAYTYIALRHYANSCCLVWPCTFKAIARANISLVLPDKKLTSPMLIAVTKLLSYDVWRYQFRSYYGMWYGYPQGRTQFKPGILIDMIYVHLYYYSSPSRCELLANHMFLRSVPMACCIGLM